jgi:hypothetical protein
MECFTTPVAARVAIHHAGDIGRAVFEARAFFGTGGGLDPESLLTTMREWGEALAAGGGGTLSFSQLGGGTCVWEIVATHRDIVSLARPAGLPQDAFFDQWAGPQGGAAMIRLGPPGGAVSTRLGVAQHAYRDGPFCGDAWAVAVRSDRVTALVLDGLGHGPIAAIASGAGIEAFLSDPERPPLAAAAALHAGMVNTVGGVGALASYASSENRLEFVGLGDISGRLIGPTEAARGLASDLGIFGVRQPRLRLLPYQADGHLLVLHTDGVRDRWRLGDYPGLQRRHPSLIAAVLHRDFGRDSDDGTVLVLDLAAF